MKQGFALFFIITCSLFIGIAYSQCIAEIHDEYSSGWAPVETVTTTPSCPGCTYPDSSNCACNPNPVDAGPGQPGTLPGGAAGGGPCGTFTPNPATSTCYGLSIASWNTIDNVINTGVPGLTTNAQVTQGVSNMNPAGYFDTALSSTGLYAVKLSTDNGDDDMMGFVLVCIFNWRN